jgi:nucleoside-diphosphate-sugar epimerase
LAGKDKISINKIAEYAQRFGAGSITYIPSRKDDFEDQNVCLKKAKRLLSWEPKIKFEEGIKDFFNWILTCYQ